MRGTEPDQNDAATSDDRFRVNDPPRLEDAAAAPAAEPPAPEPAAAPEPEPAPAPEPPPPAGSQTPHARGMQAIIENRRRALEKEVAYAETIGLQQPQADASVPLDAAPAAAPRAPAEPRPAAPATPAAPAAATPPAPVVAPDAPAGRTYRVPIRGRMIDVPEADLVQAAATAFEQQLQAIERQQPQQPTAAAPAQPAPPPPPEPPTVNRELLADVVRTIQFAVDPDEATEALNRYTQEIVKLAAPPVPVVDQDAIARYAADQAYARMNTVIGMQNTLDSFTRDYADIAGDPMLTRLATLEVSELRDMYAARGISRSVGDLMREAGENVRTHINRLRGIEPSVPTPQPTPPAPPAPAVVPAPAANGSQQRVTVKRNTPSAPAASAAPSQANTGPRLVSGERPSEVVNWMARTRPGQAAAR